MHNLCLYFLAKAEKHSFISKVYHMQKLIVWKIIQIDSVPIWLLYWWTMVSPNHPVWIYLSVKVPHIGGTLKCNFVIPLIWIELCEYFTI